MRRFLDVTLFRGNAKRGMTWKTREGHHYTTRDAARYTSTLLRHEHRLYHTMRKSYNKSRVD